jgi:hypothetical protein
MRQPKKSGSARIIWLAIAVASSGAADAPWELRYVNKLQQGIAVLEAGSYGYARMLLADSTRVARGNLLYAFELGHEDGLGSLDPTDAGKTQRFTLVGEAHQRDDTSFTSVTAFLSWYDLDLFNDFTYFLFDPVQGDQLEQQDRRLISGIRAFRKWDFPVFGHQSETTIGLQARNDDINNSLHHTEDRADRVDPRR